MKLKSIRKRKISKMKNWEHESKTILFREAKRFGKFSALRFVERSKYSAMCDSGVMRKYDD